MTFNCGELQMKKIYVCFVGLIICTSFIHSAKQETNQPSTQLMQEKEQRKRNSRRRTRKNQDPVKIQHLVQRPDEYLSIPQKNITPIVITNRFIEDKQLSIFFTNIEFTHSGITAFFNHTFNRKDYGTEFLPHNFSHLAQFIEYAQEAHQSKEFTEGVLRLFNQKIKTSPYVSAPAFERMLTQTSPYFTHQLAQQKFSLWQEIKDSLMDTFKVRFSFLQENPLGFFEDISKEIADKVTVQMTTPDRVRFTLLRFLTSSCDKLIWSPHDQQKTWETFKSIGNTIEELHKTKVIPDELDAHDLYWSLVERYAYFMELVGSQLNLETCQIIKEDIKDHKIAWLETQELEAGLQTKVERLAEVLITTEAKIRAGKMGLITDGITIS